MKNTLLLSSLFTGLILASFSKAADPIPTEDDYYKIVKFEIPKDVVLEAGATLSKEEILEFIATKVAKWQVPDDVVFIDEVPKTSVGKFSKKTLRDRFENYQLPTA